MEKELYSKIYQIEESHWWYVARREIIFDWAIRALSDYENPRILDVGCGTGFNLSYIENLKFRNNYGLDITFDALDYCRSRRLTHLACGDCTSIPFESNSFDVILALDLIEHLDDDLKALQEFQRLLSSNGKLIIFSPAFNFLWGLQDQVSHHRRRYRSGELKEKLNKAGLEISKITYVNFFLFPLVFAGRMLFHIIPYPSKMISEADLSPQWSNDILKTIFASEKLFIRRINFPIGASIFCVARKN